jgi:hypothetical protein
MYHFFFVRGVFMKGNEYFKQKRETMGFSFDKFTNQAKVGRSTLFYIESGDISLTQISTERCVRMFRLLDIPVSDFYDEFYPYKDETARAIDRWDAENPLELRFPVVKRKVYNRLCKIKERKLFAEETVNELFDMYNSFFTQPDIMKKYRKSGNLMSVEDYEVYVVGINYRIMSEKNSKNDGASGLILDKLAHTRYSVSDLSSIVGDIGRSNLSLYFNTRKDSLPNMHIISLLKICYVLDIDFNNEMIGFF